MGQYKSRDAWDPTMMTGDKKSDGPSPAAERRADEFELGNVAVTDSPPPAASARPSRTPWIASALLIVGAAAFALLEYLPLRRSAAAQVDELQAARDANSQLVARLEEADKARAELDGALAKLQTTVAQKEQALAELSRTQEELSQKLEGEIKKGDVLIKQREGELVVDLVDKILFDSGEAELNEQGQAVLKKVGETFLKIPDKVIQVGGHTDNIPMSPKLIERFPTNWELSAARAINVVRFLHDGVRLPGQRLVATGFSEYRPAASNRTSAGRQKNRRIEVVLLPVTGALAPAARR